WGRAVRRGEPSGRLPRRGSGGPQGVPHGVLAPTQRGLGSGLDRSPSSPRVRRRKVPMARRRHGLRPAEEDDARSAHAPRSRLRGGPARAVLVWDRSPVSSGADRAGVRGFADITLEKRIPAAAGLGGGSSDAAATLKVLNDLWDCGLDERTLLDVGASIGSDVPALLMDGPAIARGRGDRVEPAEVSPLSVAVVTFPFGVSTRDAFAWWDEAHGTTGPDPSPLVEAALSGGEAL